MITNTTESEFKIKDVNIEEAEPITEGKHFNFRGYYGEPTYLTAGMFFFSGSILYYSEGNSLMKGYRAYIEPLDNEYNAKTMNLNIDGQTTSIHIFKESETTSPCCIYNINGQKMKESQIDKLPKGIYIQNGKKFIIP